MAATLGGHACALNPEIGSRDLWRRAQRKLGAANKSETVQPWKGYIMLKRAAAVLTIVLASTAAHAAGMGNGGGVNGISVKGVAAAAGQPAGLRATSVELPEQK